MAIAIGQFTIYDFHDVYSSPVAPIKPTKDMLWLDTSVKPPLLRVYNGTEWVIANDFTDEIENAITETKKEINQSIESKISTAKSEILLSVKETYETKETVTAKVNSTKNELNSEIGKKANSADVYKKTETYTKTEVDNAITVNKNGIMTQVKETYETKENVTTKIDNIKFGGRNYIEQSKGDKKLGFFLNFDKVENGYGEHTLTSQKTYSNVNIAPGFILGARDYEVGKNIVFSYDIMYTKWDFPSGTTRSEFWIGQRYTNSSTSTDGQWRGVTQHNLPIVGENGCELNKWLRVVKVLTIPSQAHSSIGTASSIQFYNSNAEVSASVTFRIRNVKIEYGTKVSDWTPAYEDYDLKLDDLAVTIDGDLDAIRKVNTESIEKLDKLVNDDIITPNEKGQLNYEFQLAKIKYEASKSHYSTINDTSCSPLLTVMTDAFNALSNLVDPVIADMTTETKKSMSEIYNAFDTFYSAQENLISGLNNSLANTVSTNKSTITQLATSVDVALSQASEALGETREYAQHFKFSSNGWVEIFATVNGEEGQFKTQITNEKLAFLDNNVEVAYISNKSLYITDATITNSLNIGKIEFVPSALGGVMMIWKG